jgi:hypothetical protein
VFIPAGVQVTYDIESGAALKWVRIDGQLLFSRLVDTKLVVETLLVAPSGKLEIGTKINPLTRKATVEFRRISPALHWSAIELGLIVLGDLSLWGKPTTSWAWLGTNPRRGDQALVMREQGVDWQVGGAVVIPGVIPPDVTLTNAQRQSPEPDPLFRNQHELRTIIAIHQNIVQLSAPLSYDTHRQLPVGTTIAVGHLHRNIVIRSADTAIANRGHVMLMPSGHGKRYELGYFALVNIGRTHTETHVTDPQAAIPESLVNPRGRYSLHFHKMGPDNHALVRGVALTGSLKWGIVNHGSVVDVEDCISYDCDGAHFASEAGNEKGSFVRNMGIYCAGFGRLNKSLDRILSGGGIDKRPLAAERNRVAPLGTDLGYTGSGIWMQGPLIRCQGNEIYGAFDAGIAVDTAHRVGTDHNGEPIGIPIVDLPAGLEPLVEIEDGKVSTQRVPFDCADNRTYGCTIALEAYGNAPPDGFYGTFHGGGHYNTFVGINHWPTSVNQLIEDIEFLNDPSLDPGARLNDLYGGTRQFTFRDIRASNFATGLQLPNFGVNVVEGAATRLECQYNIHITDANAEETTVIRLAESNFGEPTHRGKAFIPSRRMDIRMEVDTTGSFIRNIEWHRPGLPKLRLWSNPEFAPHGAFAVPKCTGVATEVQ